MSSIVGVVVIINVRVAEAMEVFMEQFDQFETVSLIRTESEAKSVDESGIEKGIERGDVVAIVDHNGREWFTIAKKHVVQRLGRIERKVSEQIRVVDDEQQLQTLMFEVVGCLPRVRKFQPGYSW